ncbi:portal protein [Cloacibacillus porcorum]|uniref:Phage tail protein n=1 Tax=Cloacibacillus porcorum TaxID=1197717 RepID=A0A1B2I2M8_9BACT|nr:portal protein [Cloacibacillus porcorum]ANZ44213.1 hypothetical protein BED41_03380 [Cloacibacillus porcorum]
MEYTAELRKGLDQRRAALRNDASYIEPLWQELRDYIHPFRGRFAGEKNDRLPDMLKVLSSVPGKARSTLVAGMQSGLTSPSRQWFMLSTHNAELSDDWEVRCWLDDVHDRMMRVMQGSNFYHALHNVYEELVTFGTGVMVIVPDYSNVIRCTTLTCGRYWLGASNGYDIDCIYRDFDLTAKQIVSMFGEKNVSDGVRLAAVSSPFTRFEVHQAIEPDYERVTRMPFRSCYWESGGDAERVLSVRGYHGFPAMTPRWHCIDNDVYGYGPGAEALPDAKELRIQIRDRAVAIRKQVAPPLVAPEGLRRSGVRSMPNGITYVPDGQMQQIQQLYNVQLNLPGLQQIIQETADSIRSTMYADLFLMLQQSGGPQMTAREIIERHEEKMLVLGPVLGRLERELLSPAIERIYSVMYEAGLIPEAPEALRGTTDINIEFVSILAQAQKMQGMKPIEQSVSFIGSLAASFPEAADALDVDAGIREYCKLSGAPAKLLRDPRAVEEIRARRAQAAREQEQLAQMQAAIQSGQQAAQGAEALANTDVRPGSALSAVGDLLRNGM